MLEIWKSIEEFKDYEVSNCGRVRIATAGQATYIGRIVKAVKDCQGYYKVSLCTDGKAHTKRVHVLVAKTFLGPVPKSKEVNHKDLNKGNPKLSNLEYLTKKQNAQHALKNGAYKINPHSKLTELQVRVVRSWHRGGIYDYKKIAKHFCVPPGLVLNILRGKTWKSVWD